MEWFLYPVAGTATKEEIDQRLNDERDAWDAPWPENTRRHTGSFGDVAKRTGYLSYRRQAI